MLLSSVIHRSHFFRFCSWQNIDQCILLQQLYLFSANNYQQSTYKLVPLFGTHTVECNIFSTGNRPVKIFFGPYRSGISSNHFADQRSAFVNIFVCIAFCSIKILSAHFKIIQFIISRSKTGIFSYCIIQVFFIQFPVRLCLKKLGHAVIGTAKIRICFRCFLIILKRLPPPSPGFSFE